MLRTLESESVQCVVTSPPYFQLRDYGVAGQIGLESTPAAFIAALVAVFDEVWRVLRPDGVCFVNIGDSYAGSGKGPTGANGIQNAEQRQGFTSGYLRANGEWSTGGRKSKTEGIAGIPAKNLLLIPERFVIAMQDAGWYVRSKVAWCKKSPMPESVVDRPTSAWEPVFIFMKSARYFWDQTAVRQPWADDREGRSGGQRGRIRNVGGRTDGFTNPGNIDPSANGGANLRNYWLLGPEPSKLEHWASFPSEIPRRCIKAATSEKGQCPACGAPWARVVERERIWGAKDRGTTHKDHHLAPQGPARNGHARAGDVSAQTLGWQPSCSCPPAAPVPQTVLDPFAGSFTTCLVADQLGRDSIGIELSPAYVELGRKRIERDCPMFSDEVQVEAPVAIQAGLFAEHASGERAP